MSKPETVLNEYTYKELSSSMEDAQEIGLDAVIRSELTISRTDLESHASVVLVGRNILVISDANRIAELTPFTHDYDSIDHFPIVDTSIRYDDECTG